MNYTAKVVGKSVQVDIDRGGFAVERGSLVIRNSGGVPGARASPLSYVFEGRSYPVLATTSGTTATLTPVVDAAKGKNHDATGRQEPRGHRRGSQEDR